MIAQDTSIHDIMQLLKISLIKKEIFIYVKRRKTS